MTTRSLRDGLFIRVIAVVIITSFMLTSGSFGYRSSVLAADSLRGETSATRGDVPDIKRDLFISHLKDGSNLYVVTYDDKRAEKKETAGGKCAQLAWAYNRGIPNPLGFNINVDAVRQYYKYNSKLIEMIKEARNLDITDAKKRAEMALRIQNYMMKETKLPPDVYNEIKNAWIKISRDLGYPEGELCPVAFRGSGIIEDFEGMIAWFKKTIGAQPGQGTTLLNKSKLEDLEPSVIEVIAGLFNDQIFVYRDVQIFFDFVSKMKDVAEYNKLIQLSRKYGFNVAVNRLESENSPGYVNLRKIIGQIEEREAGVKEQYGWLQKLEDSANSILEPMNFTTGVAVLEMADSLFSGTAFTSHLGTGFDGSTYAKKTKGLFPQKKGDSFQGYTRYVKINLGTGLGPGIVEGKFVPNVVTYFDTTGAGNWVPTEFSVGTKHMSLIYMDKVMDSLKPKFSKEQLTRLANLYAQWQISGKQDEVRAALQAEFKIDAESWIRAMMDLWYFFGKPDKYKATAQEKDLLLRQLNVTEDEFFTLAHVVKHINKVATSYDTASYMLTSPELAKSRLLSDEGYKKLADMIARVGNLMAQERLEKGDKGWRERRDIEFSVVRCNENDTSKYKVRLEHSYDLVTGKDLGPGWVKILHIQNRPINPEKEIQDPDNIIFKKMKVDEDFVESHNIKPIAKDGLVGYGATEGVFYFVSPYKDLAEQEDEVGKMKDRGINVIVVLEEMGPEHDPIVEKAGAAIVWRGNDTSHAYIFSLELKIPIVINAALQPGTEEFIRHGIKGVIDGAGGKIYRGDQEILLLPDDLIIRVDMLPETKVGMIVSELQSAQEIARLGTKSVLTRMEFLINNVIKIYPQAGWAYDLMIKLDRGDITEKDLTFEELKDVNILRQSSKDIEAIEETIVGFPSAMEFMAEKMRYASNALGAIFPELNEMRAYDNKEKEALLYGLIGAKLYLRYDDKNPEFDSPLTGMRGSALMSHPHMKKGFQALNRGVIRSIKDGFKNNAFFFVYLRNADYELKTQLEDFEKLCESEGAYPEEIGTMIELGGNIWNIKQVSKILSEFVAKHKKDGVKSWYISFGTNDLTNSLGKTSREDKDFTGELKVLHPALINVEPAQGRIEVIPGAVYGPKEKGKSFIITINDEAAPGVIRFIENATAVVRSMGGHVYLCGQAVSKAINKGDVQTGMKLLSVLDAVGTQSITYVSAVMMDYDTRVSLTRVNKDALAGNAPVAQLSDIKKEAENAVLVSKSVIVDEPEDILNLRDGKNKQKIVILKATWERKELEDKGIPWDYLNYAGAILLDESVKPGTGILAEPSVKSRIKARLIGKTDILSGEMLTIVYGEKAVYKGILPTYTEEPKIAELRMPKEGLAPTTKPIVRISASDLFESKDGKPPVIDIHPLAFVLFKENPMSLPEDVRNAIAQLIDKDPLDYIQERFAEYILSKTEEAIKNNQVPVYTVFRLTRNQMRNLKGGEAIEKAKGKEGINFDDPQNRLQGGARAISDFWPIFNCEIGAFRSTKKFTPQLRLQLSAMGTRSQEIIEMLLRVLKSYGITSQNQEIGLELTTSLDPLQIEEYIKQGIKFFSYNDRELAEAILSANLNHPDMFTVEGKEAMVRGALEPPVAYMRGIVAEHKADGVWLGLNPQQPINELSSQQMKIRAADNRVYQATSAAEFDNVVSSVKGLADIKGTVVVGANVIFENAGAMTALKAFKETKKVVVYAEDNATMEKLKAMGIEEVTDNLVRRSGNVGLEGLTIDYARGGGATVLIASPLDLKGVDTAAILNVGVQLINLQTPKANEGKINSMPLVIARAFTSILQNNETVTTQFKLLNRSYSDKGQMAQEDSEKLDNLTSQVCDVPLVQLNLTEEKGKEALSAQTAYIATVDQI